jgi:hypothetical protein
VEKAQLRQCFAWEQIGPRDEKLSPSFTNMPPASLSDGQMRRGDLCRRARRDLTPSQAEQRRDP